MQGTKVEMRFRTSALTALEQTHKTAIADVVRRELHLFGELKVRLGAFTEHIRQVARSLAALDVLCGFAELAEERDYVRPIVIDASHRTLEIVNGRHAVVEQTLSPGTTYVPNSFYLGNRVQWDSGACSEQPEPYPDEMILCGANASGKSCAIRSVGLISILAQSGSFVPAESARVSVTDRVFTRVGAVDDVGLGQSTFQVEMAETACMLAQATPHSLVLLDEIGRGTGIVDGIAIAWAVAEHLACSPAPRTLFVTHYHELNELSEMHVNVKAFRLQVVEANGNRDSESPQFIATHRVEPGASWDSFGLSIAKRAGCPILAQRFSKWHEREVVSRTLHKGEICCQSCFLQL